MYKMVEKHEKFYHSYFFSLIASQRERLHCQGNPAASRQRIGPARQGSNVVFPEWAPVQIASSLTSFYHGKQTAPSTIRLKIYLHQFYFKTRRCRAPSFGDCTSECAAVHRSSFNDEHAKVLFFSFVLLAAGRHFFTLVVSSDRLGGASGCRVHEPFHIYFFLFCQDSPDR